ncbi:hypothetical protein V8C44DRAFT_364763 [Trichoderma aethiopicum]
MSLSSPEASTKMECLGNYYSCLSSEQQSQFYNGLLRSCHSLEVLRQERVVLPNEELPPGTPIYPELGVWKYAMSPKHHESTPKRKAVAIACDFGIAESGRNEPLAVSLIDCLTGGTLFSSLVDVSQQMFDWRDHIHGIDWYEVNDAVRSGNCLKGWRAARARLFEHIDDETILVGYGIRLSLELLRVFHTKIVDSQVLLGAAVFPEGVPPLLGKGRYKTPLLHVCSDLLHITLRQGIDWDVGVYDSLENTLATREIALKCIQKPAELEAWAQQRRLGFSKRNPPANILYHDNGTSNQTQAAPLPGLIVTQQAAPKPVALKPVALKPVAPKPVALKQVVPEQVVPAEVVPKHLVSKQAVPAQVTPKQTLLNQAVPIHKASDQNAPNQKVTKQVTSLQDIPEPAITKQVVTKQIIPKRSEPNGNLSSNDSIEKYEAGYKTGFDSGFQMGYERGLEKATKRQKTSTEEKHSNKSHCQCRSNDRKLIQTSDDEDEFDNRQDPASSTGILEDDKPSAVENGGLLAELMKDDRLRDIVQRGNLD